MLRGGVNMEALHQARVGAQAKSTSLTPTGRCFQRLADQRRETSGWWTLRLSCPARWSLIRKASELCTVSIAHTSATYEEAKAACINLARIPHPSVQRHARLPPTGPPALWARRP